MRLPDPCFYRTLRPFEAERSQFKNHSFPQRKISQKLLNSKAETRNTRVLELLFSKLGNRGFNDNSETSYTIRKFYLQASIISSTEKYYKKSQNRSWFSINSPKLPFQNMNHKWHHCSHLFILILSGHFQVISGAGRGPASLTTEPSTFKAERSVSDRRIDLVRSSVTP